MSDGVALLWPISSMVVAIVFSNTVVPLPQDFTPRTHLPSHNTVIFPLIIDAGKKLAIHLQFRDNKKLCLWWNLLNLLPLYLNDKI